VREASSGSRSPDHADPIGCAGPGINDGRKAGGGEQPGEAITMGVWCVAMAQVARLDRRRRDAPAETPMSLRDQQARF